LETSSNASRDPASSNVVPIALYILSEIGLFRLELNEGVANDDEGPDCDSDLDGVGGGLAMLGVWSMVYGMCLSTYYLALDG